ncbi:MAG: glycosyltransferase family A protein [Candidatus Aenigmatarchaeota archaeon]
MNISVVVIARNEEKYIEECLKRLYNQTIKAEIIVVDGHSADRTFSIAKRYADKVLTDNGQGVSDARNVGWKAAKGDVIAYCDADCLPSKDWIENISKLMDENICISGPLYPYDGDAMMKMSYKFWTNLVTRAFGFIGLQYVWGPNMAIKKSVLKKHPFKTRILEDYDLARRIRSSGRMRYFKDMVMPVSSRSLKHGFHLSMIRFYARNFLRLRFGYEEKIGGYWQKEK